MKKEIPAYLKTIADAPPDLLHVGEDVPFSSVYGTKDGYAGDKFKLLPAEELRAKIAAVTEYVTSLHRAGVRWVIPYINNKAVIGDHVRRTGMWKFFDRWDQYQEFGFGPRPSEDLVQAQMDYPFRTISLSKPGAHFYPNKLYQMCGNHPTWRQYLLAVTANIAKCGYDGTFVDEMDLHDYCPYDQAKFREYVMARYDSAARLRRYGTADANALRLGNPGEGALWHDTQAFWSESLADLLAAVRDEGRKYRPNPLRHDPVWGELTGVAYAGYTQETALEFLSSSNSNNSAQVGLWNLLALPEREEVIIPTHTQEVPRVYAGPIAPADLVMAGHLVRFWIRGTGIRKIGIRAASSTGRLGYLYPSGEDWALVVRNFTVNPSSEYIDVPWDQPTSTSDLVYSTQACSVHNELGSYCELEYHAPAIGAGTGQTQSHDASQVWAFRGPQAAIQRMARELLSADL